MKVKVKLDKGAFMPEKAHENDAGYDIRTPIYCVIESKSSAFIDTGVHIEIPKGYVGFLKSKSGLNRKDGILIEGVIDSGYTGSIGCKIYNNSEYVKVFEKGDKLVQLVLLPILEAELIKVEALEDTERGNGGFGSSGK